MPYYDPYDDRYEETDDDITHDSKDDDTTDDDDKSDTTTDDDDEKPHRKPPIKINPPSKKPKPAEQATPEPIVIPWSWVLVAGLVGYILYNE